MILHLHIENYALIEVLDCSWEKGMTAITGETGSGKSIVLGALGLALGNRAETQHVRTGANKCVIEATFVDVRPAVDQWLKAHDFDPVAAGDSTLRIRREVLPNGRGRAFIQDSPAKVAELASLGELLVDLHGQDETRALLERETRLRWLDDWGNLNATREAFVESFKSWQRAQSDWSAAKRKLGGPQADLAYIEYQIQTLQSLHLDDVDEDALEAERSLLTNASEVRQQLLLAGAWLGGDEGDALTAVRKAMDCLNSIASHMPEAAGWSQRLASVKIELDDIAAEAAQHGEDVEEDPKRLATVENVLDELRRAMFKFKCADVAALRSHLAQLIEDRDASAQLEDQVRELEKEMHQLTSICREAGRDLRIAREEASKALCSSIQADCISLKMPNTQMSFAFKEWPEHQWDEWGIDDVEILFSANPGSPPAPLKLVASGGERSRLMLAMKAAKAKSRPGGTIVLDEIDSGVSGEVATRMADLMAQMAERQQVFTVTHLPQVAARGQHHVEVSKQTSNTSTITTLHPLSTTERVTAIARMLSGDDVSEAALENARSLMGLKKEGG